MRTWYRYMGRLLIITGVLHSGLGLGRLIHLFNEAHDTNLTNSIVGNVERGYAFWFTFTGLLMILMGYLMDWIVRKKELLLPAGFGYALTGLCVIGVIMLPNSGFWLVLLQGLYLVMYSHLRF